MDRYKRMLRQMNPPKDSIILLFSFMKRKHRILCTVHSVRHAARQYDVTLWRSKNIALAASCRREANQEEHSLLRT